MHLGETGWNCSLNSRNRVYFCLAVWGWGVLSPVRDRRPASVSENFAGRSVLSGPGSIWGGKCHTSRECLHGAGKLPELSPFKRSAARPFSFAKPSWRKPVLPSRYQLAKTYELRCLEALRGEVPGPRIASNCFTMLLQENSEYTDFLSAGRA